MEMVIGKDPADLDLKNVLEAMEGSSFSNIEVERIRPGFHKPVPSLFDLCSKSLFWRLPHGIADHHYRLFPYDPSNQQTGQETDQ